MHVHVRRGPSFGKVRFQPFSFPTFLPLNIGRPTEKNGHRNSALQTSCIVASIARQPCSSCPDSRVAQAVLAGECGSSASPIWSLSAPRTSAGPLPPVAPDAWHVQRAFRTRPAFSPLRTSAPRLRPILVCNSCCALCPLSSLIVSSPPLHLSLSPYSSATHPYPYCRNQICSHVHQAKQSRSFSSLVFIGVAALCAILVPACGYAAGIGTPCRLFWWTG